MFTVLRAPSVAAILAVVLAATLATAAHARSGVESIVSRDLFEQMLLHRNDAACPAHGFYTYDAFLAAAAAFPSFGTTGSTETRKREVAAFFGQTSHETTGGWATAPDGPYSWGYCFKQEQSPGSSYCQPSSEWPCAPGKQYYGRGPIQLSWNYNYGPAGRAIGVDLLNNPDLVATDPTVSFKTALWFWMTAQANKPSCHDVITDQWRPTDADNGAGRAPGYGVITNIINGGLECGRGQDSRVEDRIGFYKRYCDILGVGYGSNLDCYHQRPFSSGLSSWLATAAHAQQGVASIVSRDLFEQMLLHRNDVACPAHGFYTYDAFLAAAAAFPSFGTTGSTETRKREVAAFFGQTSHETTGGWATAPDGPYSWGYCFKQEQSPGSSYCQPSSEWPCAPGKQYYGRGPIQLSWNYNYGLAGRAIGVDLLNNPDLVATDPTVSFKTALWFWMTAQANKPSCHDVITDQWRPSDADNGAGRVPGYGLITNIINGGLECGRGQDSRVEDRIGFYKRYCDILGVGYGSNLDCYNQRPFSSGHSAWLAALSAWLAAQ